MKNWKSYKIKKNIYKALLISEHFHEKLSIKDKPQMLQNLDQYCNIHPMALNSIIE